MMVRLDFSGRAVLWLIALMVVSIGLSFAMRSVIQLTFGGQPAACSDLYLPLGREGKAWTYGLPKSGNRLQHG